MVHFLFLKDHAEMQNFSIVDDAFAGVMGQIVAFGSLLETTNAFLM